ncbi:MAG: hypothetical protein QOG64_819 [Acidimicrobiaceae bacterium]|jgi:MOSC domain-containing protein YiiM|nr:hypothetical protein [Acidimicrobiaceae bacterium]
MAEGRIEALFVTPEPKADPVAVASATAIAGKGLDGDRYALETGTWWKPEKTGQHITLIDAEVVEGLRAEHGLAITPAGTRRNVVTSGVDLDGLIGHRFWLGGALCVGVRTCPPCAHLEGLTVPGVRSALEGVGGLRADVLAGGEVAAGDTIRLAD